jgi:hypothetical protein
MKITDVDRIHGNDYRLNHYQLLNNIKYLPTKSMISLVKIPVIKMQYISTCSGCIVIIKSKKSYNILYIYFRDYIINSLECYPTHT